MSWEATCCFNRLRDFHVIIPRCYKDVFINSFFFCASRLWNFWPVEGFLWLMISMAFKSRVNTVQPETKYSNIQIGSQDSVYSCWQFEDIGTPLYCIFCNASMLFLLICVYWDRYIVICFRELLRWSWNMCACTITDEGVKKSLQNSWISKKLLYIFNLIMEQILFQCLCSVELKGTSGASKVKTKMLTWWTNILLKNYDQLISISMIISN